MPDNGPLLESLLGIIVLFFDSFKHSSWPLIMPQDTRRSAVYRSFLTCNDPRGVIECNTIRKSQNDSKKLKEEIIPNGVEKLSSFHISDVSRGPEKLSEATESFSSRKSFDDKSKHAANDMLRGAIDLQESLVMLGKLQQASKYMTKKSKTIYKEENEGERLDAVIDSRRSYSFGDYGRTIDFERPRMSAEDSSRDCYDELREVIRDNFARQKMLPQVSTMEKDFVYRTNMNLPMDFISSSSSQSSIFHSRSPDHSQSTVRNEKPKRTNLIAKLMGLEEEQPNAAKPRVYKQMVKEKLLSTRSDLFYMDLPAPRKSQFMVQKVGRDRRTTKEMIETMEFEAIPGRKSIDNGEDSSDVRSSGKSLGVEGAPPIVIMKSVHAVNLQGNKFLDNNMTNEEKVVKSKRIPRKMREEIPPSAAEVQSGTLKLSEANRKSQAGRKAEKKLSVDKETKHFGESPAKFIRKTPSIEDRMPSTKRNYRKPLAPRTQKKEASVGKIESAPVVVSVTRKAADIKGNKSHEPDKAQDPCKTAALSTTKTARGSDASKHDSSHRKTVASTKLQEPLSLQSFISKEKGKSRCEPSFALAELKNNGNMQESSVKKATQQQIVHELMDASHTFVSDVLGVEANSYRSSVSTMGDNIKHNEDRSIPCPNLDQMKVCNSISNLRYVYASNVPFLDQAKELLVTSVNSHKLSHTGCLPDSGILYSSLLLDCAKEILERRNQRCTRTVTPPVENLFRSSKRRLSLEQLVREISDGIKDLRSYSKSYSDNVVLVDAIYPMLERDVLWNGEVAGAWDSGWMNGFTMEQIDEVVNDVEKLVLSNLIDDLVRYIESVVS